MGRLLAQRGQRIGFWDGVVQKFDDRYLEIRDLALQVFEAGSKPCKAKIAQKIVRESMLHGINS